MKRNFIYVGNAESNDISVFRLDDNGQVEPIQTVPFDGITAIGNATPLTISPDRKLLYAGIRAAPFTVLTFAIDAETGHLRQIGRAALADSMAYLSTDRRGRFLFSASYGGSVISVNPIGADGVAGDPIQVVETGLNAHAILPSPDNRLVFASNLGSDQVLAFRFDAETGILAAADPERIAFAPKSGPRHFVFSPDGRFTFAITEHSAEVLSFGYDAASGFWQKLAAAGILPEGFEGVSASADIHVTPDGRFIYASERTSSTLKLLHFDAATGQLRAGESFATEKQPRGFTIDPTGRFLVAVGELSHRMTIHAIDPNTGSLTVISSHATGRQPNWVEIVAFD
ncbi:beta-propeller fold lactonase family protein [Neorhizobium sp. JUb45]|uniref:lactonase family protein n=1 Tax=unclassified Neorhizobium TaxID=2629175 RepID=UPI00104BE3A8|nr:beta-propeller fold lactonase family protein [Neorhizobium sp. JUb45]TCR01934.1 6-phosphogluconolactonase [Neorhizobium sp. JUb45]